MSRRMRAAALGLAGGILLLTACEDATEPESLTSGPEETAGAAEPDELHREDFEPFEGEFTVDTARWQPDPES